MDRGRARGGAVTSFGCALHVHWAPTGNLNMFSDLYELTASQCGLCFSLLFPSFLPSPLPLNSAAGERNGGAVSYGQPLLSCTAPACLIFSFLYHWIAGRGKREGGKELRAAVSMAAWKQGFQATPTWVSSKITCRTPHRSCWELTSI